MGEGLVDELLASWPPRDPDDARGYRRVPLTTMRPVAALPLPLAGAPRAWATVVEGDAGHAVLPLIERDGAWQVAVAGDGVAEALLARLADDHPVPAPFASDHFAPLPIGTGERGVGVDQTNRSVVVGEAAVVKWYTHAGTDGSRAAILLGHLGAVGFDGVPLLHATLTWSRPHGAPRAIALVDELVSDARDGWEWCVAAVVGHAATSHRCAPDCPARFARRLGRLVGELHIALASPSPQLPHPRATAGPWAAAAWREAGLADMEATMAAQGDDRLDLVAAVPRIREALDALAEVGPTATQPIHGDLHVGQVLDGPVGMRVIDFDGPVDRDGLVEAQPTALDVAHLLVSLELVAEVARRRLEPDRSDALATWAARARASLLVGYRAAIATVPIITTLDDRLLRPFVARQLCRELLYAASTLPRWRYAPMGAIARLYAGPRP